MLKKLFGPLPDECCLYGLDKMIGLFTKLDANSKTNAAIKTNSVDNKKSCVVSKETITENKNDVVTITQKDFISEKLEISSRSSKKYLSNGNNDTVTCTINERTKISERVSTSKILLKRSSSMECNYTLSKTNVGKYGTQSARNDISRQVKSGSKSSSKRYKYFNTKSICDSVEMYEKRFERKVYLSDPKNRVESILRKEMKHQRKCSTVQSRIKSNFDRPVECLKTVNETSSGNKDQHRKVIKTEWAVTRINTFDDHSRTYEVMKKDKIHDDQDSIQRIFAIGPNSTTIAYDPLKNKSKHK